MKIEHSIALEANNLCSKFGITPNDLIQILHKEQNILSIKDVSLYDMDSNTIPLSSRFKKSFISDLSSSHGQLLDILLIIRKNLLYYQSIEIVADDVTRSVFSIGEGEFATKLIISK